MGLCRLSQVWANHVQLVGPVAMCGELDVGDLRGLPIDHACLTRRGNLFLRQRSLCVPGLTMRRLGTLWLSAFGPGDARMRRRETLSHLGVGRRLVALHERQLKCGGLLRRIWLG